MKKEIINIPVNIGSIINSSVRIELISATKEEIQEKFGEDAGAVISITVTDMDEKTFETISSVIREQIETQILPLYSGEEVSQ